jgi:hypothetical protein
MHQLKFEYTKSTKRLKKEHVCTFEKRFKTKGGIGVSGPWGCDSTNQLKNPLEELTNH